MLLVDVSVHVCVQRCFYEREFRDAGYPEGFGSAGYLYLVGLSELYKERGAERDFWLAMIYACCLGVRGVIIIVK